MTPNASILSSVSPPLLPVADAMRAAGVPSPETGPDFAAEFLTLAAEIPAETAPMASLTDAVLPVAVPPFVLPPAIPLTMAPAPDPSFPATVTGAGIPIPGVPVIDGPPADSAPHQTGAPEVGITVLSVASADPSAVMPGSSDVAGATKTAASPSQIPLPADNPAVPVPAAAEETPPAGDPGLPSQDESPGPTASAATLPVLLQVTQALSHPGPLTSTRTADTPAPPHTASGKVSETADQDVTDKPVTNPTALPKPPQATGAERFWAMQGLIPPSGPAEGEATEADPQITPQTPVAMQATPAAVPKAVPVSDKVSTARPGNESDAPLIPSPVEAKPPYSAPEAPEGSDMPPSGPHLIAGTVPADPVTLPGDMATGSAHPAGPVADLPLSRITTAPLRPGPDSTPQPLAATLLTEAAKPAEDGVSLTLSPEELGNLHLKMVSEGDRMIVTLTVERTDTLDLLRRHADELAQELRGAGYADARFSFSQGGSEGFARSGSPGQPAHHPAPSQSPAPVAPSEGPLKTGLDLRL